MEDYTECRMPAGWKDYGYKPVAYDLAEDGMYFCMLYPAFVLLLGLFGEKGVPSFLWPFLMLGGMLVSTLIRRFLKRMVTMLPLEFTVFIAVTAAAPRLYGHISFGIVMFAVFCISIARFVNDVKRGDKYWAMEHGDNYRLFAGYGVLAVGIPLLYITTMVSQGFGRGGVVAATFVACVVLLAIFEAYVHLSGAYTVAKSTAASERLRGVSRMFAVIAVSAVAAAAGVSYLGYSLWLRYLDTAFLRFLSDRNISSSPPPTPSLSGPSPSAAKLNFPTDKPNPYIAMVLNFILKFVEILAVVFAILVALFLLYRALRHFLGLHREARVEHRSVFSFREAVGRAAGRVGRHHVFNIFGGRPNNLKVRRAYFRFVGRQIRKGARIAPSDAPADIGIKLAVERNLDAATRIYEKARYSVDECTYMEVAEIRRVTR
jgi:hypothetical protein